MGDDRADLSSDQAAGASGRRLRTRPPVWAIALMVVASAVVVAVVSGAVFVVQAIAGPFMAPNVDVAVWHVQGMPCVTWARASTEGGGFDLSPSAVIQVGLRPHCSDAEIDDTYRSLLEDTVSVRERDEFRIEYLVSDRAPAEPAQRYAPTKTSGAQLTIDKHYDLPAPEAFASTVDDWNSVRRLVDPGAQLELLDHDFSPEVEERFVANSTAARLRALSASLPKRLAEQAWKITIPATGSTAFVREDAAPDGGVTLETAKGFPEPWLVDFGAALNGTWPDNGRAEYVYVFRDPPNRGGYFNEVSARVFHVAPAGAGGRLPLAQDTAAWPALTAALDAMASTPGSKDQNFAMGFSLASRSFTARDEHSSWSGNSITGDDSFTVVSPSRCSQPAATEAEAEADGNAIAGPLCHYYSQRATTADGGDGGN